MTIYKAEALAVPFTWFLITFFLVVNSTKKREEEGLPLVIVSLFVCQNEDCVCWQ